MSRETRSEPEAFMRSNEVFEMFEMSLSQVCELTQSVLRNYGFSHAHVKAAAETMVSGERDECRSHGLYRFLGCIATLKAGKVDPEAVPQVHDQAPGIVRVDARGGFSQLAFELGLPALRAKATANGIAAMAINNCVHCSALWVKIEAIPQMGLVALACNPSHAWVTPAGGSGPVFGTNPLAFGWPRAGRTPFVFDFATSEVARGKSNSTAVPTNLFRWVGGWTRKAIHRLTQQKFLKARCRHSAGTKAQHWRP